MGGVTINPVAGLAKPPEPGPSPVEQYANLLKLKQMGQAGMMQQQQGQIQAEQLKQEKLATEKSQRDAQDRDILTKSMQNWDPSQGYEALAKTTKENGGSFDLVNHITDTALAKRKEYSQIAKDDSETGKNNIETLLKKYDVTAGAIKSVLQATDEQLGPKILQTAQELQQQGLIDPQHAQAAQQVSQMPPAQARLALQSMVKDFQANSQQLQQAKDEAEISKNTAQAGEANAKTGLTNLETKTFGKPTEKDKYIQGQENYRATLSRQSSQANELQKQGISSLQKQSDTYSQFLGTAQSLKNSLAAAKDGNQLAAAVAPLQGTLFITTSEGVKRINETELRGVAGAGSLVQRIEGKLGNLGGGGPLSSDLKDDMAKLVDLYVKAKHDSYSNQAAYTKKLHALPETTPILDENGNIAGEGSSKPSAPASGATGSTKADALLKKYGF